MTGDIPLRAIAAIQNGELQSLQAWLGEGGSIFAKENTGENMMHKAAFYGQVEIAKFLLQQGLNIDSVDNQHFTPLHEAARAGQAKMVAWLLDKGADAHALTLSGRTALDMAVENARSEETAALLRPVPKKPRLFLSGSDELIRVTQKPEINRTLTEVFNFRSGTYMLIIANNSTRAESTVMRTFDEIEGGNLLEEAQAAFVKLGGKAPDPFGGIGIDKKKLPRPGGIM